jgi:hypothetical protein
MFVQQAGFAYMALSQLNGKVMIYLTLPEEVVTNS